MKWKIPLFKIYWSDEDIEEITKVIKRGTYWSSGPEIAEFEQKIAHFVNCEFALSFNSGTTALYTLLKSCNLKNTEVILPSFTFIATANTVLLAEAKPVFAEIEQESFGLNAANVQEKITKKTRAIIPVHIAGQPIKEIKAIKEIAEDNDLLLLEDAAQALGSYLNMDKVGNFGHGAMFSLCQNKIITTGEGGIVVTNDRDLYEKMKLIRSHGRVDDMKSDYFSNIHDSNYIQLGSNYRLSTIQAALGISQLNQYTKIVELRRKHAQFLTQNLKKIDYLIPPTEIPNAFHIYQLYIVLLDNKKTRDQLQRHLSNKAIMTKIYFKPIHLKSYYKANHNFSEGELPITEDISNRVLALPIYPMMTKMDLNYIIDSINEF